jgi:hypothetical protein
MKATARTLDCSACGCEVAYHEMHPDFSRQVFVRNKLMRTPCDAQRGPPRRRLHNGGAHRAT